MRRDGLLMLVEGFFLEWMERDRKLSPNTVDSYRRAFTMFFEWLRDAKGVDPLDARMAHFDDSSIREFLGYLEEGRGCSPKTVNCRLAAFWSFARYVSRQAPEHIYQMSKITGIPKRKERRKEIDYLTPDEVGWLMDCCEPGSETELMLALLFNSGARISEIIEAKVDDVVRIPGGRCHLHVLGKGSKDSAVPLWEDTSQLLATHIDEKRLGNGDYLFSGRGVSHLTRSGARSRLDSVVKAAKTRHPELSKKTITPHVFRHSTAMAMLAAGVDIATVAIWLGHESINTTHKYVVSDMRIKEEALAKVRRDWGVRPRRPYKADRSVLDFLNSL